MWHVVDRAEIAARPGRVWRVVHEIAQSGGVPPIRIDITNEPHELAWTSLWPHGDGAEPTEARWWFKLAPNWTGTEVEHGLQVERAPSDADQLDARRRLVSTLATVKTRAEAAH